MKYESSLDHRQARCIEPGYPEWPSQLDSLPPENRPDHLWVLGEGRLNELVDRAVVVTGARAATAYGETVASDLACGLATRGNAVLNGGGYGIDQAALRGACAVHRPAIVVQANGLDGLFPSRCTDLFESVISRGGLIISEHDPDVFTTRARCLGRNRLFAALGTAIVIVESAPRGSLTGLVDSAQLMARPIMAFPGPVTSATSIHNHRLIRAGRATLVTSADDVIHELDAAVASSDSNPAVISAGTVLEPHDVKPGMHLTIRLIDTPPGFVEQVSYSFIADSEPQDVSDGQICLVYRGGRHKESNFSIGAPWVITLDEDFAVSAQVSAEAAPS